MFQQFDELKIGSPGIKTNAQLHPIQALAPSQPTETSKPTRLSFTGISSLVKAAIPKYALFHSLKTLYASVWLKNDFNKSRCNQYNLRYFYENVTFWELSRAHLPIV